MKAALIGRDRSRPLRADWESVKDAVMRDALRAKFTQHPDLREKLLSTGDALLIEHTRNDSYCGDGGDGSGKNRLGGSILAQVFSQLGDDCPDVDDPALLKGLLAAWATLRPMVLAYHDRSDGGLFATICEMAFAGHCGVTISLDAIAFDADADDVDAFKRNAEEQLAGRMKDLALRALYNEELGAVLQIRAADRERVIAHAARAIHDFFLFSPEGVRTQ